MWGRAGTGCVEGQVPGVWKGRYWVWGRAGTAYGEEKSVIQGFGGENWEKEATCKTYAYMKDNIKIDF